MKKSPTIKKKLNTIQKDECKNKTDNNKDLSNIKFISSDNNNLLNDNDNDFYYRITKLYNYLQINLMSYISNSFKCNENSNNELLSPKKNNINKNHIYYQTIPDLIKLLLMSNIENDRLNSSFYENNILKLFFTNKNILNNSLNSILKLPFFMYNKTNINNKYNLYNKAFDAYANINMRYIVSYQLELLCSEVMMLNYNMYIKDFMEYNSLNLKDRVSNLKKNIRHNSIYLCLFFLLYTPNVLLSSDENISIFKNEIDIKLKIDNLIEKYNNKHKNLNVYDLINNNNKDNVEYLKLNVKESNTKLIDNLSNNKNNLKSNNNKNLHKSNITFSCPRKQKDFSLANKNLLKFSFVNELPLEACSKAINNNNNNQIDKINKDTYSYLLTDVQPPPKRLNLALSPCLKLRSNKRISTIDRYKQSSLEESKLTNIIQENLINNYNNNNNKIIIKDKECRINANDYTNIYKLLPDYFSHPYIDYDYFDNIKDINDINNRFKINLNTTKTNFTSSDNTNALLNLKADYLFSLFTYDAKIINKQENTNILNNKYEIAKEYCLESSNPVYLKLLRIIIFFHIIFPDYLVNKFIENMLFIDNKKNSRNSKQNNLNSNNDIDFDYFFNVFFSNDSNDKNNNTDMFNNFKLNFLKETSSIEKYKMYVLFLFEPSNMKSFVSYISHNYIFIQKKSNKTKLTLNEFKSNLKQSNYAIFYSDVIRKALFHFCLNLNKIETKLLFEESPKLIYYYYRLYQNYSDKNIYNSINTDLIKNFNLQNKFSKYENYIKIKDNYTFFKSSSQFNSINNYINITKTFKINKINYLSNSKQKKSFTSSNLIKNANDNEINVKHKDSINKKSSKEFRKNNKKLKVKISNNLIINEYNKSSLSVNTFKSKITTTSLNENSNVNLNKFELNNDIKEEDNNNVNNKNNNNKIEKKSNKKNRSSVNFNIIKSAMHIKDNKNKFKRNSEVKNLYNFKNSSKGTMSKLLKINSNLIKSNKSKYTDNISSNNNNNNTNNNSNSIVNLKIKDNNFSFISEKIDKNHIFEFNSLENSLNYSDESSISISDQIKHAYTNRNINFKNSSFFKSDIISEDSNKNTARRRSLLFFNNANQLNNIKNSSITPRFSNRKFIKSRKTIDFFKKNSIIINKIINNNKISDESYSLSNNSIINNKSDNLSSNKSFEKCSDDDYKSEFKISLICSSPVKKRIIKNRDSAFIKTYNMAASNLSNTDNSLNELSKTNYIIDHIDNYKSKVNSIKDVVFENNKSTNYNDENIVKSERISKVTFLKKDLNINKSNNVLNLHINKKNNNSIIPEVESEYNTINKSCLKKNDIKCKSIDNNSNLLNVSNIKLSNINKLNNYNFDTINISSSESLIHASKNNKIFDNIACVDFSKNNSLKLSNSYNSDSISINNVNSLKNKILENNNICHENKIYTFKTANLNNINKHINISLDSSCDTIYSKQIKLSNNKLKLLENNKKQEKKIKDINKKKLKRFDNNIKNQNLYNPRSLLNIKDAIDYKINKFAVKNCFNKLKKSVNKESILNSCKNIKNNKNTFKNKINHKYKSKSFSEFIMLKTSIYNKINFESLNDKVEFFEFNNCNNNIYKQFSSNNTFIRNNENKKNTYLHNYSVDISKLI